MTSSKNTIGNDENKELGKRLPITLSPGKITTALIVLVSIIMLATIFSDNLDLPKNLKRFLNVGSEHSLPTWYSSIALLFCSLLLGIIGHYKRKVRDTFHRYWTILAIIFLVLSKSARNQNLLNFLSDVSFTKKKSKFSV